jgi:uncharacterized membrane protein YfcA
VQAYQVLYHTYRKVDWGQLGRMMFFACLGLPVGVWAVSYLPRRSLLIFLGAVLIASGATSIGGREPRRCWPPVLLNALLVLGGIVHGAFVSGGATLVVYAQHMVSAKDPDPSAPSVSVGWVSKKGQKIDH